MERSRFAGDRRIAARGRQITLTANLYWTKYDSPAMTDGEVIDPIERAELFAKKLRGVIEVVAAGPCADAQAAGLRRIRLTALLRQLRHRAGQGWDRRSHAAWLTKLFS
jgi:hypothetical protein